MNYLFNVSWISRWYFKDIARPVNSSIRKTCFMISSDSLKNSVKKNYSKSRTIYYMKGNRKYRFYSNNSDI